jgi:hypothetical protein
MALVGPLLWRRRPKNPSHKIVCSCICAQRGEQGQLLDASEQTFADRADCGTLDAISCTTDDGNAGNLERCQRRSVPTSLIDKLIWGGRPEVKL